eukprot:925112_1
MSPSNRFNRLILVLHACDHTLRFTVLSALYKASKRLVFMFNSCGNRDSRRLVGWYGCKCILFVHEFTKLSHIPSTVVRNIRRLQSTTNHQHKPNPQIILNRNDNTTHLPTKRYCRVFNVYIVHPSTLCSVSNPTIVNISNKGTAQPPERTDGHLIFLLCRLVWFSNPRLWFNICGHGSMCLQIPIKPRTTLKTYPIILMIVCICISKVSNHLFMVSNTWMGNTTQYTNTVISI